jgi:hypothetical protein
VCNTDIEVINCTVDVFRKFSPAVSIARPAHPHGGGIQLWRWLFAFAVTCLDSGVTDCTLQTSGQAPAIIEIGLPTYLFQQIRSLVDGVGCHIATVGHAIGRPDDQHGKKEHATPGPPDFSHEVLYEIETMKVNNIDRGTGLGSVTPL